MVDDLNTLKGKLGMLERRHFGSEEARAARVKYDTKATISQISARLANAKAYIADSDLQADLYAEISRECAERAAIMRKATRFEI